MCRNYFLKTRQKIAKRLIHVLYKFGGLNPLSNAHLEIGILNPHSFRNGEDEILKHLGNLNEAPVIFDVGANIGKYAKLIKNDIPNAKVFSFEPNPSAFEKLSQVEGIRAVNIGMGSKEDEALKLYIPKSNKNSGLASIIGDAFEKFPQLDVTEIDITTIKKFCIENEIDRIDFLKIDTEGFELEVMKGAQEMLQQIPFIQFEMNYHFIYTRTFLKDFYDILPNHWFFRVTKKGLIFLDEYNPINEIFRMHNILCVHTSHVKDWKEKIRWIEHTPFR